MGIPHAQHDAHCGGDSDGRRAAHAEHFDRLPHGVNVIALQKRKLAGQAGLVDHADMSAEILQPILQSSAVTVHAYRKLRWGGKMGLLLEAA